MSSFWDKYLAPGDVRAKLQPAQSDSSKSEPIENDERPAPAPRIDPAHRARRQNALLFGGLAFSALSLFITRRALIRKKVQTVASFTPSNTPPPKVDGGIEAIHALGLATLNVFSFAMVASGGLMKFFDVADIDDMREAVRAGVGYDIYSGDSAADKELEAWVAEVLSRKDGIATLQTGIAEKLLELEQKESSKKLVEERRKS